jgi:hypothetical protein
MKTAPPKSVKDVIPATELLLDRVAAGDAAGRDVTRATVLVAADDLSRAMRSRTDALPTLGERVGHEWVDTRLVGKSLLSCIYLERFSDGLLVWRFVWYRNDAGWRVLHLDVSTDLRALVHVLPNTGAGP